MSGRTTSLGGTDTCRGVTDACGGVSVAAGWAGGLCCAEGRTPTWGSVESTPVSGGCSPGWSNPQVSGGCGSSIQGRLAPMVRASGSASPGCRSGSGSAAADRYQPAGRWLAPTAVSGSVRRAARSRASTRVKGSRCTDSRTDRGTDRTAARIARSGGYRLVTAVHRST